MPYFVNLMMIDAFINLVIYVVTLPDFRRACCTVLKLKIGGRIGVTALGTISRANNNNQNRQTATQA